MKPFLQVILNKSFICSDKTTKLCVVMNYIQSHNVALHAVAKFCVCSMKPHNYKSCWPRGKTKTNLEGGRHTHDVEFLLTHSLSWNKQKTRRECIYLKPSAVFIKHIACHDKAEKHAVTVVSLMKHYTQLNLELTPQPCAF